MSHGGPLRGDGGGATVEAAIVVGALIFVVVLCVLALSVVSAATRCTDAAREAARLVARGDQGRAEQAVRGLAPDNAVLSVRVDGDEVTVEVRSAPVGGPFSGWQVHGRSYAVLEPGVPG